MQQTTADLSDLPPARTPQAPTIRRFRTVRVVMALILREIGSRDSRSSLGFLWAIIDPIATVAILSIAFALISRTPRLGTNFPLYYVTGILPFHMFNQTSNRVSGAVRFSRQLLGFPVVTFLDAILARYLLNTFINLLIFIACLVGVIYIYDLRVNINLFPVIEAMVMASTLALGVGTFNSLLFILYPTYDHIWGMFSRPMTLAAGVMILIEDLPDWLFHILWWNPAAHFVALMRSGIYPTYQIPWVTPYYVFFIAGITFVLGLIMLSRYVNDALDK